MMIRLNKNSSSLLFSAVDGSLQFSCFGKRWREFLGPLDFFSLLHVLLDIWKMLYLWHWINLSLYDSILFLLYQFCLLYTMIFQIADSSPPSLQENFPVVCFPIFFCFTCRVLTKSIKDLYNEFSLNSLTSSNFFICINCNYFRSSHVINMIFNYLYNLFVTDTWNFISSLSALWYPIPYHFVLSCYFYYLILFIIYLFIYFIYLFYFYYLILFHLCSY